ncbi:MAG: sialidase family protein [bacterium]
MHARSALALAGLLLLAGCSTPSDPVHVGPTTPPSAGPWQVTYDCPPGSSTTSEFPVCTIHAGTTASGGAVWGHAQDAKHPNVIVLSMYGIEPTDVGAGPAGTARFYETYLLVTQDGGSTWKRVDLPKIPTLEPASELAGVDDVMVRGLTFGPDGVLHLFGGATHEAPYPSSPVKAFGNSPSAGGNYTIFHVSTPDLGVTWGKPTTLGWGQFQDFAEGMVLADGTIVATFNGAGQPDEARVSHDAGATWQAVDLPPTCYYRSWLARVDGKATIGCTLEAEIWQYNATSGAFEDLAPIPGMGDYQDNPWIGQGPDGNVTMILQEHYGADGPRVLHSHDGGRTWSKPVFIAANCQACAGLYEYQPGEGYGLDGQGNLHVVFAGSFHATVPNEGLYRRVHAVYGPDLTRLHDAVMYNMSETWTPDAGYAAWRVEKRASWIHAPNGVVQARADGVASDVNWCWRQVADAKWYDGVGPGR